MQSFTERAIDVIRSIPKGRVCSYGAIAKLAGSARNARQVAWLLRRSSDEYSLPWQRVVNRQGLIVLKREGGGLQQRELLLSEGVEVSSNGQVDLTRFGWMC